MERFSSNGCQDTWDSGRLVHDTQQWWSTICEQFWWCCGGLCCQGRPSQSQTFSWTCGHTIKCPGDLTRAQMQCYTWGLKITKKLLIKRHDFVTSKIACVDECDVYWYRNNAVPMWLQCRSLMDPVLSTCLLPFFCGGYFKANIK